MKNYGFYGIFKWEGSLLIPLLISSQFYTTKQHCEYASVYNMQAFLKSGVPEPYWSLIGVYAYAQGTKTGNNSPRTWMLVAPSWLKPSDSRQQTCTQPWRSEARHSRLTCSIQCNFKRKKTLFELIRP